jgi:hypothetical protein
VAPGSKAARGDVIPSTGDVRGVLGDVISQGGARQERIRVAQGEYTLTYSFEPSTGTLSVNGPYGPGGRYETHTFTSMTDFNNFQKSFTGGPVDVVHPTDAGLWAKASAAGGGGTPPAPTPTPVPPGPVPAGPPAPVPAGPPTVPMPVVLVPPPTPVPGTGGGRPASSTGGVPAAVPGGIAGAQAGRPPSAHEQREAAFAHQFTADNQLPAGAGLVVERVNPAYRDPPGAPADIVAIQGEITNILAKRAEAEAAEQAMARQQAAHTANKAPFEAAVTDTRHGISAAAAHQQAVARKDEATARKKAEQDRASSMVSGYPGRAAGTVALTGPLAAFERFSHYASMIPGAPGRAMGKLHTDSTKLLGALYGMDTKMGQLDKEQPGKQAQIEADKGRLAATTQQGKQSEQQIGAAQAGATALAGANEVALRDATAARSTAAGEKQELAAAAQKKTGQGQTLAARLQAWAQEHQQAREKAVAATRARLEQQGYEASEKKQP